MKKTVVAAIIWLLLVSSFAFLAPAPPTKAAEAPIPGYYETSECI
jgi:hypothetical protein